LLLLLPWRGGAGLSVTLLVIIVIAAAVVVVGAVIVIVAATAITGPRSSAARGLSARIIATGAPWRGATSRSTLPWFRILAAAAAAVVVTTRASFDLRWGRAAAEFLHELLPTC
jgi:glycerol-3-phosphate acyltransferase PlsY